MLGDIFEGAVKFGASYIGGKKRLARREEAQAGYDASMRDYFAQDTSNLYSNLENTMEDLTVNTQAADFTAQQQAQGLSNIMGSMNQAAGGSGIAALAQSLAGAQSQNLQRASANIGQQERANQAAAAQQAGNLQLYEAKGELISRDAEQEKVETMFGMAQGKLAEKKAAFDAGEAKLMGGIGGVAGGILGGFGSGAIGKGTGFGDLLSGESSGGAMSIFS